VRRKIGLLVILAAALIVVYTLNRLTADWHYLVPTEPGKAAYVAVFDGFTDEWALYQGTLEAAVADGALRLEIGSADGRPFSTTRHRFADFDVRVEAKAAAGPLNNGFGLLFRLQEGDPNSAADDSYYWFLISSDGYYQVMRVLQGREKRLSEWIPTPIIQQGIGATNWLRVVARGDTFEFYINNKRVPVCVPDNPDAESTYSGGCIAGQMQDSLTDSAIPHGRLGVIAHAFGEEGVIAVEFDNLWIMGPASAG
jgi:hypothetical protein